MEGSRRPHGPFCTDVPVGPSSGGERPAYHLTHHLTHHLTRPEAPSVWLRGRHLWAAGESSAVFAASQPSVPSSPDSSRPPERWPGGQPWPWTPHIISEALYASWPRGPWSQDRCLMWGRAGRSGWCLGGERSSLQCPRSGHVCCPPMSTRSDGSATTWVATRDPIRSVQPGDGGVCFPRLQHVSSVFHVRRTNGLFSGLSRGP